MTFVFINSEKVLIRATSPYGFRNGQWAEIVGIVWRNDRPCYQVRFVDDFMDVWVVNDPSDPYEFKAWGTP